MPLAKIAAAVSVGIALLLTSASAQTKLDVVEVRPSFFVIAGAGANVGVQVGEDGVVVVDTGAAADTPGILAEIKRLSPKPIRYIINTGPDLDHLGGNQAFAKAGERVLSAGGRGANATTPIVAVEGVQPYVTKLPADALPNELFNWSRKAMYLNGEAIEVFNQPAHTDGDAIVFFRRSDVVVAGDALDTRQFPVIDVARGGSIQRELAALNRLVELAVPSVPNVSREAGTVIVPGHGRLCDYYDVVRYRDMVTIVRDRIADLIKIGRTLAEVKAAQPAKGYVGRYGNAGAADRFIEAVYQGLAKEKP
jgi:glyoxylase-like metal-dependent hydrolase (beta-lactamase superfamily II)